MFKLVLASQSPRRSTLLKRLIADFEVRSPEIEEHIDASLALEAALMALAKAKAAAVFHAQDEVILAADTVVLLQQTILGKPNDVAEARAMLQALSNQTHTVISAVALKSQAHEEAFVAHTQVRFKTLSLNEIETYIEQHQPFDKAGAYGIQDGIDWVTHLDGEFENVMGLPLIPLAQALKRFGFDVA
jgi:septum formation protein